VGVCDADAGAEAPAAARTAISNITVFDDVKYN